MATAFMPETKRGLIRYIVFSAIAAAFLFAVMQPALIIHSFAEEKKPEKIVINDANVTFVPFEDWVGVTRSGMDQRSLDLIPVSYTDMKKDFDENHGCYYAVSSTRLSEMYVSSFEDERSRKIYDTADGEYTLIRDYLSSPFRYKYMKMHNDLSIKRCTDKVKTEAGAVFYMVEYKYDKGEGICYSAVVNGKYISFDFLSKKGELSKTERIEITNLMKSVEVLNIEEREKLDMTQIIIIAGAAFLGIVFVAAIVISVSKKRKEY